MTERNKKIKFDMGIETFKGNFKHGVAKPSKFRVQFILPSGITGDASGRNGLNSTNPDVRSGKLFTHQVYLNNGAIDIFCHSCSLPQRYFNTFDQQHYGPAYRVPISQNYDPVSFGFYSNEFFDSRAYFELWQSAAINLGTNTLNYYNEYVSNVTIFALDGEGNEAYSVTLFEAYPLNIGMVDLNYGSFNTVSDITVTMGFRIWKSSRDNSAVEAFY